jgi:CSLREA domain-containing protein
MSLRTHLRCCLLLLGILPAGEGWSAQFVVDSTADAIDALPGDGRCATAAEVCTLRAAISEADATPAADVVRLPAGTFTLALTGTGDDLNASGDLDVRSPLQLLGAGAAHTIIDGNAADRVLDLHAGASTVVLEELALANGRIDIAPADQVGVGLRVPAGVQVELRGVDIRDNTAPLAFRGAIGLDNAGCVHGERVRLLRNRDPGPTSFRALAGAIATRSANGCLTLEDSEISDNVGDIVGGIYLTGDASMTLRRTLIAGNRARQVGGLLNNRGDVVLLEDVTISGNRGISGAALNDGGTEFRLRNCTVTGNGPAGSSGIVGGINDVHGGFGLTFISNTVIAGNGPGFLSNDCDRLRSVGGGNVIGNLQGCMAALQPSDRSNLDPQLGPLADLGGRSRAHLPGPPLLDSGQDAVCTSSDQRGVLRPQDGDGIDAARCDIGAIEWAIDPLFSNGFEG